MTLVVTWTVVCTWCSLPITPPALSTATSAFLPPLLLLYLSLYVITTPFLLPSLASALLLHFCLCPSCKWQAYAGPVRSHNFYNSQTEQRSEWCNCQGRWRALPSGTLFFLSLGVKNAKPSRWLFSLQKQYSVNIELLSDPVFPLLDTHPREMKTYVRAKANTRVSIAVLSIVAPKTEAIQISINWWINEQMWYIHMMDLLSSHRKGWSTMLDFNKI